MTYLNPDTRKKLLSSLGTVKKASEISLLLDDLRAATYTTGADISPLLEKLSHYSPEFATSLVDFSGNSLREFVEETQLLLRQSERIKVEMSYAPSSDFAGGLYEVFSSLGYRNFLFDFNVSSEVGTGARFYHDGNFLNVSMFDLIKDKLKGLNLEV